MAKGQALGVSSSEERPKEAEKGRKSRQEGTCTFAMLPHHGTADGESRLRQIPKMLIALLVFGLLPMAVLCRPASDEASDEASAAYVKYNLAENTTDFKRISQEAFRSLKSFDAKEDERLRQGGSSTKKGGGGQGRKKLPSRNQAIVIAKAGDFHHAVKCEAMAFKQRVKMKGCLSKVIVNRFCHGTCSSYWIPKARAPLRPAFSSCAQCQPIEFDMVEVTLDCPERDPPQATRTIAEVKRCACRALDTEC